MKRRQFYLMEMVMNKPFRGNDRKEALFKLLSLEPDTLERLTQATGWGYEVTQHTLLQLIVDDRVVCRDSNGRRFFHVKRVA